MTRAAVKLASRRQTRSERELCRSTTASGVRAGASSRASAKQTARATTAKHHPASAARAADRADAVSPAETLTSGTAAGTKRKKRDFESDEGDEETNIHVVVRCRGRNGREVRENSAVVVNTDGVKAKQIELCVGANMLNNKTYCFDRVFSQAADQSMVFDDTVKPMLDEVLAGYNCTIFAYGQTGTGKTYTMSGDMTDTLGMLSDEAGIIPRLLQQLFNKLEIEDAENCVKCSFIELYNEELRDLLSADEGAKLKIYDDASRRGHASTLIQGMEEKHIKNAAEGIKVLQDGSLKRQVAATNFNDRSSRSHTVFTITAYVKKTNDNGVEDMVSAGKLNLVDLAGSENIQRSGAENKRAAEAGMINKSLLTLGRVINALVDHSSHIPYRESKLTRLLQDSLGGRTKTCIIATISPAKSNLEETMSTLDYAFRAKNIRNKPQLHMTTKKTLLKDFTSEIEKLKSELISTRQRNGVYLSNEMYEEIVAQSESRRIAIEEQGAKMETLETNLRNKAQELFSLISSFMGLKKDHEGTKAQLDETKGVLDQTEIILSATRKSLATETFLRKEYERTEEKLTEIGGELINKLDQTVNDVTALHAKVKRKSDLQSINRTAWGISQAQVADVTSMVERQVLELREEQRKHISSISARMEAFVGEELKKLLTTQAFLDEQLGQFAESKGQLLDQKQKSKRDMNEVLAEIMCIRDTVQDSVAGSLQGISQAADKVAADALNEMANFRNQLTILLGKLHSSYTSLGGGFKSLFDDLVRHISAQRSESDGLRRQLHSATSTIILQNAGISTRIQEALEDERRQAAEDRQMLLIQISNLVNQQAEAHEARLVDRAAQIQAGLAEFSTSLEGAVSQYAQGMDAWDEKEGQHLEQVQRSRAQLETKLEDDLAAANEHNTCMQNASRSVHEIVRAMDEQMGDLGVQMEALDGFVTRAKSENATLHETHAQSVQVLSSAVEESFGNISAQVKTTFDQVKNLGEELEMDTNDLYNGIEPLEAQLCQPLANLREGIFNTALQEYQPTGETPQKVLYHYPTNLPRTEAPTEGAAEEESDDDCKSDNALAFSEQENAGIICSSPSQSNASDRNRGHLGLSLREANPNVTMNLVTGVISPDQHAGIMSMPAEHTMPLLKRSTRSSRGMMKQGVVVDGRENLPPTTCSQNMSRRKSQRLN
ncbi:Kinesin-like protein bimC [Tolypocladium paradoxum]|uniref:Kinesin-like protein bimC n=1 Tax=Tolypocladium paradoxum TaxID=94208 RepID=A0A2S4KS26_9HYPO|nr:Kinesin-like protein bimC [Tolypocladium paradoxum]